MKIPVVATGGNAKRSLTANMSKHHINWSELIRAFYMYIRGN